MLLLMWVPIALPIDWFVSATYGNTEAARNLVTILTMPLLYAEFVLLVVLWGRFVYGQTNLFKRYGFRQPRKNLRDVVRGVSVGLLSLLLMFVLQSAFGWVVWQFPQPTFARIFLEGAGVAIAYGVAEELLFRGWLLDELQRGYSAQTALLTSSIIYAALHCIRPLQESIQFPALIILGLILVWAKRLTQGRLGLSIGFHAGLIWGYYIVNVGQLVTYSDQVPEWVTGIGRNPLAGIVGIFSLGAIALWIRGAARRQGRVGMS